MARPGSAEVGDATFYNDLTPAEDNTPTEGFFPADVNDHSLPIQGVTGPVGEPGLPPSRPVSLHIAPRSNNASPRVGMGSPATRLQGAGWSEPQHPTGSRTHIPNIASSTFFRPMSSRQLREDITRTASPQVPEPAPSRVSEETNRSRRGHKTRYSDASIVTMDQNQRPVEDDVPPLPSSGNGGTGYSPPDQQPNIRSMRSQGSNAPLRPNVQNLTLAAAENGLGIKAERSPRSIRRSFGWNSRPAREPKELGHRRLQSASSPSSPESEMEKRAHKPNLGRNYEYYNGNFIFFFRGRLSNTRQRPLNALTGFLAVLPAALFFAFSASYLWHHVSPAIPICFAYLFWICISSFMHASFSDPGVLPRSLHPHPRDASDDDPLALGPAMTNWVMVKSWEPADKEGPTTAMEVPVKYCKSCNIWRPPRAHHCRVCDACIETQDHHCVWLNNCVGRRNYRYFFTFVGSASLLALFLFGASLGHLLVWWKRHPGSFNHDLKTQWTLRGALAMVIYAILVFPYPASLWMYHMFLTGRGESTRDYLNSQKFLKKDRHRPFDKGSWAKNFLDVLCRPRPPTYMQFKARYDEGDVRLGNMRRKREMKESVEMKQMETNPGVTATGTGATGAMGFQGPASRGALNSTPRNVPAAFPRAAEGQPVG